MPLTDDVQHVRSRVQDEGTEPLLELAEDARYLVPCVRVFLKEYPSIVSKVETWARQVVENSDLLLPVELAASEEPNGFLDIQEFLNTYEAAISTEVAGNPEHFSYPTPPGSTVRSAIAVWEADATNRKNLVVRNDNELELVTDWAMDILKCALTEQGVKVSNLTRYDIVREARRILPMNPSIYDALNENLKDRRQRSYTLDFSKR